MSHNANDTKVFNRYQAGLWNVGSYQVAGIPWMSGTHPGSGAHVGTNSVKVFQFPSVTKRIVVTNLLDRSHTTPCQIRISFAPFGGSTVVGSGAIIEGKHFFDLSGSVSTTLDMSVKCSTLYISGSEADCTYSIMAELTGIDAKEMFALTGSGLTE